MGVLMMLMTIGGLGAAAAMLIVSFWKNLTWLRKFVLGGVAVWFAIYAVTLVGVSLASKEKVLAMNEPKGFCGFYLDCHMHTVLTGVRTAKKIGDKTAQGEFVIASVKVFSNAKNPNITFRLLEPKAQLLSEDGKVYDRIQDAESLLPTGQVLLSQDIKGANTIEKEVVFDVPQTARGLRLSVTEGYGIDKVIESVLIGDEDSILHKPAVFKVETTKVTVSN